MQGERGRVRVKKSAGNIASFKELVRLEQGRRDIAHGRWPRGGDRQNKSKAEL